MRVDVHNRKQVARLEPRPNTWVISIHTPGDSEAPLKDGWERVERFCFSDIAGDSVECMLWAQELREAGHEVIFFHEEMAREIVAILEMAIRRGKDIVVHCDAGVSRSQAVARFARNTFGFNVFSHTVRCDQFANGLVLRIMNRLMWSGDSEGRCFPSPGKFTFLGRDEDSEEWNL